MKKKELRKLYKDKRQKMSTEEREVFSNEIYDRTTNAFTLKGKKVSLFLPIERFSEINTWLFLNNIESEFYLPVIDGENNLKHIKYENKEQIEISDWGIPEPTYGDTIEEKELDIVLVPLLAVDNKGYRVGYGKGFYDEFLSRCNRDCIFIGLSYYAPIDQITDVYEGDVRLHYCITRTETVCFNS